jgi:hypothetical protein
MRVVTFAIACIVVVGCVSAGGQPSPTGTPVPADSPASTWAAAPDAPVRAPVDPALAPVSRSNPPPDAKKALELCGAYQYGLDHVAGIAHIQRASDAVRYARLTSNTVELNVPSDAWMIQYAGERPDPITRQSWIDSTCLVIAGEPVVFATGPIRDLETGKIVSGYAPVASPPTLSLPALDP